jgi:hypothetical protein
MVMHGQVLLAGAAASAIAGVIAATTPAMEAKKVKDFVNIFIKVFRVEEGCSATPKLGRVLNITN